LLLPIRALCSPQTHLPLSCIWKSGWILFDEFGVTLRHSDDAGLARFISARLCRLPKQRRMSGTACVERLTPGSILKFRGLSKQLWKVVIRQRMKGLEILEKKQKLLWTATGLFLRTIMKPLAP
jgi:hypothetical protein